MRPNIMMYEQERLRRMVLLNQTPFYFMIQNANWEDFRRRARSHPQELDVQDEGTGNTLLHEACRRDPPPHVIQALQAVSRVKNHQGATPLHIAASHRCSAQALQVLLECATITDTQATQTKNDEAEQQTAAMTAEIATTRVPATRSPTADLSNLGRAPIHYACMSFRGLEIEAFLVLLDATLLHGNVVLDEQNDSMMVEDEDDLDDELDIDYLFCHDVGDCVQQQKRVVNVMSLKDATGKTPLELLFRKYKQRVRSIITKLDRFRTEYGERSTLASAITVHAELGELWEKARRIVARLTRERLQREGGEMTSDFPVRSPAEVAVRQEAANWALEHHRGPEPAEEDVLPVYVNSADGDRSTSPSAPVLGSSASACVEKCQKFRIVHASVGLIGYGCPPEMIRLAVAIHPHQVREMDEDGNLPIHIAAKASSYLVDQTPCTSIEAAAAFVADAADDRSVISDAMSFFSSASISHTTNPFDKVIKILLQYYPEAAQIPQGKTGNLPLVEAIEFGRRTWNDGIRTLLHAYPPALHDKKLVEPKVYPNVLALVSSGSPEFGPNEIGEHCLLSHSKASKRRQETIMRTTLFELLRTKPEWLAPEECFEV